MYWKQSLPAGFVCNEIFVIPTAVESDQTFCYFGISEWAQKNTTMYYLPQVHLY
jgi:hypothetical protein